MSHFSQLRNLTVSTKSGTSISFGISPASANVALMWLAIAKKHNPLKMIPFKIP